MEYDDEVAFLALQKIYQLSRFSTGPPNLGEKSESIAGDKYRPWCLTVSFTHPHDPYVARREFWNLYEDCQHLMPKVDAIPFEKQDPHSKRLLMSCDHKNFNITNEDIRRSRRAYFANISYLDEKVGALLGALKATRMDKNTIIVFCSDHGDMLGERGLWFKMNFFEGSARVPLMISLPETINGSNVDVPVSTLDLCPTLVDLIGLNIEDVQQWIDGQSLSPWLKNKSNASHEPVLMEYCAEGTHAPIVAIRTDKFKYIHSACGDPDQLYDLNNDSEELNNLATDSKYQDVLNEFRTATNKKWDLKAYDAEIRQSQARRRVVYEALRNGVYYPWDFQPLQKASERFMRNLMDLNHVEYSQRFPRDE